MQADSGGGTDLMSRPSRDRRVMFLASRLVAAALLVLGVGLGCRAVTASPSPDGQGDGEAKAARAIGPAPRDADGRFENWTPGLPRVGPSVTFPFFLRRIAARFRGTPEGLPERVPARAAWLRENTRNMTPSVTWVGHATLLVQMGGQTFLTDPTWSSVAGPAGMGARRYMAPGISLDALPPIDFVLISHNHYDHLDKSTLKAIAERSPSARFIVPLGNGELLTDSGIANVVELDWGAVARVGPLEVHCLPAQHWSQRGITDQRKALWASWAVVSPQRRFYFGGDTGYFEGFRAIGEALGPFDLAAVPIGAYEPQAMMKFSHLDPEQAVQAALDVRAKRMLAMHYGTFDLSDEPLAEPPLRFHAAARAAGLDAAESWTLAIGETRTF